MRLSKAQKANQGLKNAKIIVLSHVATIKDNLLIPVTYNLKECIKTRMT